MKLTLDQMLLKAATVATRAHDGHKRKDGTPYISHPIRVAIRCETPEQKIVALLHDVVEDTDVTAEDLREMGFTNEIVEAILSVTKIPGQTYREFIRRANQNDIGRVVKVRDIEDNLEDQSALDPDEAAFLTKRYTEALRELELPHE